MAPQPLKRSKHLLTLSKDHHAGLLFCWKIKEGLKKNIDLNRIEKYIAFFWEHHLREHFQEEETLLFNRVDDPLCLQAKTEHRQLENRLTRLSHHENETTQAYSEFAELLIKHIRFEERVLFPHLEIIMPASLLNNVGDFLIKQHAASLQDNYPDEFWVKQPDQLN